MTGPESRFTRFRRHLTLAGAAWLLALGCGFPPSLSVAADFEVTLLPLPDEPHTRGGSPLYLHRDSLGGFYGVANETYDEKWAFTLDRNGVYRSSRFRGDWTDDSEVVRPFLSKEGDLYWTERYRTVMAQDLTLESAPPWTAADGLGRGFLQDAEGVVYKVSLEKGGVLYRDRLLVHRRLPHPDARFERIFRSDPAIHGPLAHWTFWPDRWDRPVAGNGFIYAVFFNTPMDANRSERICRFRPDGSEFKVVHRFSEPPGDGIYCGVMNWSSDGRIYGTVLGYTNWGPGPQLFSMLPDGSDYRRMRISYQYDLPVRRLQDGPGGGLMFTRVALQARKTEVMLVNRDGSQLRTGAVVDDRFSMLEWLEGEEYLHCYASGDGILGENLGVLCRLELGSSRLTKIHEFSSWGPDAVLGLGRRWLSNGRLLGWNSIESRYDGGQVFTRDARTLEGRVVRNFGSVSDGLQRIVSVSEARDGRLIGLAQDRSGSPVAFWMDAEGGDLGRVRLPAGYDPRDILDTGAGLALFSWPGVRDSRATVALDRATGEIVDADAMGLPGARVSLWVDGRDGRFYGQGFSTSSVVNPLVRYDPQRRVAESIQVETYGVDVQGKPQIPAFAFVASSGELIGRVVTDWPGTVPGVTLVGMARTGGRLRRIFDSTAAGSDTAHRVFVEGPSKTLWGLAETDDPDPSNELGRSAALFKVALDGSGYQVVRRLRGRSSGAEFVLGGEPGVSPVYGYGDSVFPIGVSGMFFMRPVPEVNLPELGYFRLNDGTITLRWHGGALESAASLEGPWTLQASGPAEHVVRATEPRRFFRVRRED